MPDELLGANLPPVIDLENETIEPMAIEVSSASIEVVPSVLEAANELEQIPEQMVIESVSSSLHIEEIMNTIPEDRGPDEEQNNSGNNSELPEMNLEKDLMGELFRLEYGLPVVDIERNLMVELQRIEPILNTFRSDTHDSEDVQLGVTLGNNIPLNAHHRESTSSSVIDSRLRQQHLELFSKSFLYVMKSFYNETQSAHFLRCFKITSFKFEVVEAKLEEARCLFKFTEVDNQIWNARQTIENDKSDNRIVDLRELESRMLGFSVTWDAVMRTSTLEPELYCETCEYDFDFFKIYNNFQAIKNDLGL